MSNSGRKARRAEAKRLAKQLTQGDSLVALGTSPSIMERAPAWPGTLEYAETSGSSCGHLAGPDVPEGVPKSGFDARLAKTSDIASMIAVHPKTIERWRRLEGLPCLKVRGTVRYDVSAVLRWLADKSREARS